MTCNMTYRYAPLSTQSGNPRATFSIRLLHVLPATDRDSRLECRLIETIIPNTRGQAQSSKSSGSTPVPYQALSYTWGEPEFPRWLHILEGDIDGCHGAMHATLAGVLAITENLHSALYSLRKSDETLVLWVDAVCIDQANIPERNSQVGNMPQTYTEAARVLVWLGMDDVKRNGQLCLEFFTNLAALITGDSKGGRQDGRASWRKRLEINRMVSDFLDCMQPRPITFLLSRSWFRRRWIVQEVGLANDVMVYCGETSIDWNTFELALTELFENDKGGFSDEHRAVLRTMSRIRNPDSGAKSQVPLDTLVEFESFVCADPRDRLYALYGVIQNRFPGLTPTKEAHTGTIDYALSIGSVFTNFAGLMMGLTDTLPPNAAYDPITHVLQLAAAIRGERPLLNEVGQRIPSWVPDWTGTRASVPLNHSPTDRDASRGIVKHRAKILTSDSNLRVFVSVGLVYDIVTANIPLDVEPLFGPLHKAKAALNDFLGVVAKIFDRTGFFGTADIDIYRPTGQHIISALATTLVANWEHTPANSYFAQHPRFPGDFLEQLSSSMHHLPEILHKWPAYVELVAITMRGRGLFLTQSGYVGVCASNVRPGDVVCILSNVRIPFILRPKHGLAVPVEGGFTHIPGCHAFDDKTQLKEVVLEREKETSSHCMFQLMSDAYIHGLMNGEAARRVRWPHDDSLRVLSIE